MNFFYAAILIAIMSSIGFAQTHKSQKSADASPSKRVGNHSQDKAHEHKSEESHEHEHEDGEIKNVGPDKGVLVANEDLGFKLREGVEERFGIKVQAITSAKFKDIPKGAIVYSKEEYQIFRKRDGFWKPIDVKVTRKGHLMSIESPEMKAADFIAIEGTGFLKIIELSVFGPAIEGHIH